MTYDWETDIPPAVFTSIEDVLANNPACNDLVVLGIVVGNFETGEGAVVRRPGGYTRLWETDIWRDAKEDAERIYGDAYEARFGVEAKK